MSRTFTDKQLAVINHNDGNIVVSASAGSGKTSVMIERLIRLIEEGRVDVKDILAVTFTRFAATEMRGKLRKALVDKIKEGGDEKRLRTQLEDLPLASISTVDSFLNSLIKKYFYLAGVDSAFSIASESDASLLKQTAISDVFEKLYDEDDPDLKRLLKVFIKKRRDEALKKTVLEVHNFLESETDRNEFINKALSCYDEEGVKNIDNGLIARFIAKLRRLRAMSGDLYERAMMLKANSYVTYLDGFVNLANNAIEKEDVQALRELTFYDSASPKFISKDDDAKIELRADFKKFFESFKSLRGDIEKYFDVDFETRVNDQQAPKEILKSLAKVVELFDEEYVRLKREQNLLDYADLSHIGYKLLQLPEVIGDVKSTYKYVFVDEYQDTNGIQESIFSLIENDNLFLVGDVKQSIYGFRGCFSGNFSKRIEGAKINGKHVELDMNFRSTKAVIDAVNRVFSATMTESTMNHSYRDHPMVYGNLYGDYQGEVKYLYLGEKAEKQTLDLGVYSVEKHLEAERKEKINYEKLVVYAVKEAQKKMICEPGGKERRAKLSDIAVLNRTVGSGVDRVVKELEQAGIPTVSENKRSIETYPEIKRMVDILKCVINPRDDIALASALKSPVGGLADHELKAVRDAFPKETFSDAVIKYREVASTLSEKIKAFFAYMERIRLLSAFEGAPTIIRRIVREKAINVELLATSGGEYKLKRLEVFTQSGYKGNREVTLEEFVSGISDFLAEATMPSQGGADAVKVVSMHASKGLEYPIVIVAGVDRNWNSVDAKEEVSCVRGGGIGIKNYDEKTKRSQNSFVKEYMMLLKREENLREELRLLYVALTRAKCVLYVVSKAPPKEEPLSDLFDAKSQYDLFRGLQIDCKEVTLSDLITLSEKAERRDLVLPESDKKLEAEIKKYVDFVYPYERDTMLSLKRTVTEIAGSKPEKDFDVKECVKPIFNLPTTEIGNAYHKFLELLDFGKIDDNGLIDGLLNEKFTKEERDIIDVSRIKRILSLNVFNEIKDYKLYKEHGFLVSVPPEIAGESGDEDVLVQGVIDLLAIRGDEVIIVDYKYSAKSSESLTETYKKQLDLYAYAAEKSLRKKVVKKVLVNLNRIEEVIL